MKARKDAAKSLAKAQERLALLKAIHLGYNTYENVDDKIVAVFGKKLDEREAMRRLPNLIHVTVREISACKIAIHHTEAGGAQ